MKPEEIARLRALQEASSESASYGDFAMRCDIDYIDALLAAADELFCAAEIAARVPPECCLTCLRFGDNDCYRKSPFDVVRKCLSFKPIGGAE